MILLTKRLKKTGGRGQTEEGGGEWIVTFADLMALLFSFFVLLTSLSAAPKDCSGIAEYMRSNREQYKNFELRNSKLECVITLPSDFLFRTGQDRMQPEAVRRLRPLVEHIQELDAHQNDLIIVEGHTDNVPINTPRFPSNWELSSARATNVAALLKEQGMPEEQLSVRAFADNRPRVPYRDEAGRSKTGEALETARRRNRRVELILQNPPKELTEYGVLFR